MRVTNGVEWVLLRTDKFDETVGFFQRTLGIPVGVAGVPAVDTRYSRYAKLILPGPTTVEIVEPKRPGDGYLGPVVCVTVDRIVTAHGELRAGGAAIVGDLVRDGQGWGWMYVRGPDGVVYQVHGPTGD